MKAIVDRRLCIRCEMCVNICPEVFKVVPSDDGGDVVIADKEGIVEEALSESAVEARDACPVNAIKIEE